MRSSARRCRVPAANTIFSAPSITPRWGFLAGWVFRHGGIRGAVAIAAMPFGTYLHDIWPAANPHVLSLLLVWLTTLVLLRDVKLGSAFQDASTLAQGRASSSPSSSPASASRPRKPIAFLPSKGDGGLITSAPFAISLYYVMYSYSGLERLHLHRPAKCAILHAPFPGPWVSARCSSWPSISG
ncbi:MAG: hypothetical protein WDN28_00080 [Chthoniobacter sp.]